MNWMETQCNRPNVWAAHEIGKINVFSYILKLVLCLSPMCSVLDEFGHPKSTFHLPMICVCCMCTVHMYIRTYMYMYVYTYVHT